MNDRVIEGIDASRRVAWAKYYAARRALAQAWGASFEVAMSRLDDPIQGDLDVTIFNLWCEFGDEQPMDAEAFQAGRRQAREFMARRESLDGTYQEAQ